MTRTPINAGDKVYRADSNPMTGEVDPAWFTPVQVLAIGTYENGAQYVDYMARGYSARAGLDQFVPRSAVKRVTINGRRTLVWRAA